MRSRWSWSLPDMLISKLERMSAAEERRKARWIASLPCLVCASTPCQAHHLLTGPGKGMGTKADGAWLVPLCPPHHDPRYPESLHADGNEARWFAAHGIDGRAEAERLHQLWKTGGMR